jgi:hypothetical protein
MEDAKIEVTVVPTGKPEPISILSKDKTANHIKRETIERKHFIIAVLGSCGVVLWILLFGLGMIIDSAPYRESLRTNFNFPQFIMTILTFTPTNIAMLCLVSSFTGGCASLLIISKAEKVLGLDKQPNRLKTNSHVYMSENPFSSMLRGIVVFFAFLAGVFVTSSTALVSPTAQAYTQAAGVVSLLSFFVGYDPTMFRTLVSVGEKLESGSKE